VVGLGLFCAACGDDACDKVAARLRECCAAGPAELRPDCEAEAQRLEDDGDVESCENFDIHWLAGCQP
jgi:hypothetical protein